MLDHEVCWRLWHELGTLNAVRRKFKEDGLINPKTGEPPTNSAIEKSAFAWATENPEEAKKHVARSWQKEGLILTDDEWYRVLVKMGKLIFSQRPGRFKKFIEANGLEKWV